MEAEIADKIRSSSEFNMPKEWRIVSQGEVATFHNGRAYKLSEWESHGTPVIRLQNLTGTGNEYYYSNLVLPDHQYVNTGELLYMWSATIGPKIWLGNKAIYHYHIWKVVCHSEWLNQSYMFQSLLYLTDQMKGQSHGSTMLHLTKSGMEKHAIALPPLPEQKKIARILSSVDSKLALIDQQITTTQTLKKGLMQKLFTQGVGTQDADGRWQPHTEFQETELGSVPKGWRVMPVGKVLAINNNLRRPISKDQRKEIQGPYPYYGPTKQQDSIATYEQDGTYALIGEDGDHFLKFASMPMTQLVHGKCTVNNHAHVLEGTEVCSAEWFYYFFMNRDIVNFLTRQGAGRYKLNKAALEKLLIAVPKKEEQEEIVKTIKSVSLKVSYLQTQKAQTQQLKKGLMQKLLTGQIRVQPDPQDN